MIESDFENCEHDWIEDCVNVDNKTYKYCEKCAVLEYTE